MTGGCVVDAAQVEQDVRRWVQRAVIGLNLCPFAKSVEIKALVHYWVSAADHEAALWRDFEQQVRELVQRPIEQRETTLLIAPACLHDFLAFHDFCGRAERHLKKMRLQGVLQLASFHPRYCFAGADEDDLGNYSNRAPYPVVHLLREDSIARAVEAMRDPAVIYEANQHTLQHLGVAGWQALDVGPSQPGTPR